MQQLLAQKVGVIIFYPLDPKATTPVLKQAQKQGVPVIAIDASFGSTKKVPLIATQVWQGRDTQAYLQAKALKKVKPNAKVGIIGIGIPVPAIKYLERARDVLGEEGRADRGRQPGQPLRRRHGRREGGERAAPAPLGHRRRDRLQRPLRARRRRSRRAATGRNITVSGSTARATASARVKSGRLPATVQVDPIGIGGPDGRAAYSLITKQNLPLPPIVIAPGRLVTKANVDVDPELARAAEGSQVERLDGGAGASPPHARPPASMSASASPSSP